MFKDEILENERRREIYRFIQENPGVHLRRIQRSLNIPLSSLEYHVDYLVRKAIVFKETDGHYMRYYVKPLDSEDKKILRSLRQRRMREIVLRVLSRKKAKFQYLRTELDIPSSTLSFYIKNLVEHDILKKHRIGRQNMYSVNDENRVAKVLTTYKSSFMDKLIDKALATWLETNFRQNEEEVSTED